MNEQLNELFRSRIGFPADHKINFEDLSLVLEMAAKTIPFENFRIMERNTQTITKQNLLDKIVVKGEGGLCYEINSMLYLFLLENGFNVVMTRGVVFNNETKEFTSIGRTHATILLTYEGQTYLVDSGFGGNLPLTPVPLTGEIVQTSNGEFRIRKTDSEHGDYRFEIKVKHKDADWKLGYVFDSRMLLSDVTDLDELQQLIAEHELSVFNKDPLIMKLTEEGSMTLTDHSFTTWENGTMTKEEIGEARYKELLKQHFGRT
ncbi:arylamine N-acetyltransferase family protein [Paenibacillus radicis (ex Gao et al. 2016)]|uniref:Arylamine N-acetyltransferase n=1 Tax=Paenibacillus radicis (ex Gao et al. 2016) TaxID=1737354 RepID=A0A917GRB7_9BACL|nr:arylamine N-acetyltransferase [Paenibacillus radicis (ex Gao et al. 2016)]GGG54310.1 arylamine N-acetyltransferase [Paenibacillus radicis (ex Gao et al. 2016)]